MIPLRKFWFPCVVRSNIILSMGHIEILFKEYDTLRAEQMVRTSAAYQFISLGVTFTAAMLALGTANHVDIRFLAVAGVAVVVLCMFATFTFRDMYFVTARLQQIERRINQIAREELGAKEDLLEWESKWASRATGLLIRRMPKS